MARAILIVTVVVLLSGAVYSALSGDFLRREDAGEEEEGAKTPKVANGDADEERN